MKKTFVVTPWEVSGTVDYVKLIKQFGIDPLNEKLLERLKKHTHDLHYFLERKVFFAHRDLNWLLNEYEKGNKFYLYTGRGPSGQTHLGHLIPWIFAKWLQDKFDAKLYFQVTDDEKFLFKENLDLEKVKSYAYENILDVIALGFDPKKTFIFLDTEYAKTLYKEAIRVAKHITFSTTKAVFGFKNETNIGKIFFTSVQAVPAFLESVKEGRNVPCLIPLGVDQDPHFRVARDVLPKLGYYKPALIHSKFLPGLGKEGKMSSSDPEATIFTTDTPEQIEKKIRNAFDAG
ncbi:MAG: tryptophan--tRNA ligase, partial [Candidatus Heimdallarchaeota archaeon]